MSERNPDVQMPDVSHPGSGLDEETAQRVASLGANREAGTSGPEYVAMDADNQAGRGADGDSATRYEQKDETT